MTPVLVCCRGDGERDLVAALTASGSGFSVARRCADLVELAAYAELGYADLAVIDRATPRLDRQAVKRLADSGLRLVMLSDAEDADDLGVPVVARGVPAAMTALSSPDLLQRPRPIAVSGTGDALLPSSPEGALSASGPKGSETAPSAPDSGMDRGGPAEAGGRSGADRHASADRQSEIDSDDGLPAAAMWAPAPSWSSSSANGAPDSDGESSTSPSASPSSTGRVIAVWGPTGAPGRTTVAVNLAAELAAVDPPVLLVDADAYGGTVALFLGLLDEAPGLVAAVRAALRDDLDVAALERLGPPVLPGLHVLTGISRASRWRELRPTGLDAVWALAADAFRWVVVDCGFAMEEDDWASMDRGAVSRNAATLSALRAADQIIPVGGAEPAGIVRLLTGLDDLGELVDSDGGEIGPVVVNRVRESVDGTRPERRVRDAFRDYAGREDVVALPFDIDACDRAARRGQVLAEAMPASVLRAAIRSLAATLVGARSGRT